MGPRLLPHQPRRPRHRAPGRQPEARARSLPPGHGSPRPGRRACRCCSASPTSCKSRIEALSGEFGNAIKEFGYEGSYTTVYPVKVNQQRHVVQEIVEFGAPYGVGLECGSKPELQAVLGLNEGSTASHRLQRLQGRGVHAAGPDGPEAGPHGDGRAGAAQRAGRPAQGGRRDGRGPTAGVRIKLATEGSGRWAKSGGERSKFGLSAPELMKLLDRLERLGRKDILKLVHFHLGSQITDIRHVKAGLEEISRYYAELRGHGLRHLTHVDVGGGLGVDYDGSRSTRSASVNYTMREYANDVVYTIGTACRTEELPMPHIISRVGPGAHGAPRAAAGERDRRRVAGGAGRPDGCGRTRIRCWPEMAENLEALNRGADRGGLPRRGLRQGADPGVLRQRRLLAARQGRRRAALPGHAGRALSRSIGDDKAVVSGDHGPHRGGRWWTATSATSRCSSRCRTTGPSTSCSRSCRSIG